MLRKLGDEDGAIRMAVATGLAEYDDPRSLEILDGFLHDPDQYVRMNAIRSIARRQDPRTFDQLTLMIDDPSRRVQEEAWKAMWGFRGTEAAPKLLALEERVRARIVAAFQSEHVCCSWRDIFGHSV